MNEESMLKRTLILTGKLVGASALWIALVSAVAVFATDRIVLSLGTPHAESAAAPSGSSQKVETTPARGKNLQANATKPNG